MVCLHVYRMKTQKNRSRRILGTIVAIFFLASFFLIPQSNAIVYAQQSSNSSSTGSASPNKELEKRYESREDCNVQETGGNLDGSNCGIIALLNVIFNFVSGGIALAVIGNIIYAGIKYSMAQGDPSTAAKAKDRIRNAVIAFIMYLFLFAFIQWLIPGGIF